MIVNNPLLLPLLLPPIVSQFYFSFLIRLFTQSYNLLIAYFIDYAHDSSNLLVNLGKTKKNQASSFLTTIPSITTTQEMSVQRFKKRVPYLTEYNNKETVCRSPVQSNISTHFHSYRVPTHFSPFSSARFNPPTQICIH